MEGDFAKELYSESLELSKTEFVTQSTANDSHGEFPDEDGSPWDDGGEEWDNLSGLDREWQKRRDQYHTIGYREGLLAAKEAIAQEGFNVGFKQSVLAGYNWGHVRGVTGALSCLPDGLKEKLIETQEKRNKYQALYESVHSLSTTDALKLFHKNLTAKKVAEKNQISEAGSSEVGSQNESSNCNQLEDYVSGLHSLLSESPMIKSDPSIK